MSQRPANRAHYQRPDLAHNPKHSMSVDVGDVRHKDYTQVYCMANWSLQPERAVRARLELLWTERQAATVENAARDKEIDQLRNVIWSKFTRKTAA